MIAEQRVERETHVTRNRAGYNTDIKANVELPLSDGQKKKPELTTHLSTITAFIIVTHSVTQKNVFGFR